MQEMTFVTRDFDLTFIPNLNTEEWSVILVLPLLVEWTVCVCVCVTRSCENCLRDFHNL